MIDTLVRPAASVLAADDRAALLDSVRRLLADRCAEADVRRIMASETGHDPELWRALADLGVVGLAAPEAAGGAGLSAVELELAMEEAGAALLPAPLLSTAVASALLVGRDGRLPVEIASGERIAAVAFAGSFDWTGRDDIAVDGGRLAGTLRFVPDAAIADTILIAHDTGVFAADRADVHVTALPTFDKTRRLADVAIDVPARLVADAAAIGPALALAIVALAGEQTGGARRVLDMTVDYARTRHQFGRAIGSFQAIKHMAADLLLEVESATSAARHAAQAITDFPDDYQASVALAAFTCADAFVRVTKEAVQMHGGIAFTWDHPAHLYLRRARSAAQLYGDPAHWRERYLQALEAAT